MNAPARTQPEKTDNIDAAGSQEDLISPANRIQARYNNLDGAAQRRSNEAYEADPDHTPAGQGSGPNGVRTLDETKTNIGVREKTIEKEEQNSDTTFKDPNQQIEANADIQDPAGGARLRAVRNPDTFEREAEPDEPAPSSVQQRIAQIEQQGDELRPTQQLPTGQRQEPQREDEDEEPEGFGQAEEEDERTGAPDDDEVVEGFGDDADAAAETGASAGRGALGAELESDAAIAAASGAETGGLGFIAAGVLGIGAALASIFAPHHDPKPPTPLTNVSAPTQTVGLR